MTSVLHYWNGEGVKGIKIEVEVDTKVVGHILVEDIFIPSASIGELLNQLSHQIDVKSQYVNYYSHRISDWIEFRPRIIRLYKELDHIYVDISGKIIWDDDAIDNIVEVDISHRNVSILA